MKNKNGFTLIELLAVIIILGILMIIAIPSVTRYISDSRKSAYVDTAKEIVAGARNLVNEGKLEMYDTNTTYYIPSNCIKTENASKSPYGDFIKDRTYVIVTYDGKGYDYYWVSLDDAGQGVPELKSVDKLDIDDIKSDLTRDDIKDNVGVGNRATVTIFNETCTAKIVKDAYRDVVCKRATTLHTATCTRKDSYGCNAKYSEGELITYGNENIVNGTLTSGDAFDCDINDDGLFDSVTERFYYVTKIGTGVNEIATLIYYTNITGSKSVAYSSKDDIQIVDSSATTYDNIHGPVTAVKSLPTTSTWKNAGIESGKIINQKRSITNENGEKTTGVGNIVDEFIYEGKAARLLTTRELVEGCSGLSNVGNRRDRELDSCVYLLENSQYDRNGGQYYWLETPYSLNSSVWIVDSTKIAVNRTYTNGLTGVRPVIDVRTSSIEY